MAEQWDFFTTLAKLLPTRYASQDCGKTQFWIPVYHFKKAFGVAT